MPLLLFPYLHYLFPATTLSLFVPSLLVFLCLLVFVVFVSSSVSFGACLCLCLAFAPGLSYSLDAVLAFAPSLVVRPFLPFALSLCCCAEASP
jgi:hypothetical protein